MASEMETSAAMRKIWGGIGRKATRVVRGSSFSSKSRERRVVAGGDLRPQNRLQIESLWFGDNGREILNVHHFLHVSTTSTKK